MTLLLIILTACSVEGETPTPTTPLAAYAPTAEPSSSSTEGAYGTADTGRVERACDDGVDNDEDGFTDCEDFDCPPC